MKEPRVCSIADRAMQQLHSPSLGGASPPHVLRPEAVDAVARLELVQAARTGLRYGSMQPLVIQLACQVHVMCVLC